MSTGTLKGIKIQAGEKVPVFPLSNAILFPNMELPLHIFEPRYRQMLKDATEGNNLVAVSLLKKGWESHAEPFPCHDVVGVGYVKLAIQNSDETSNIVLKGLGRAKISEYLSWEPYRIATLVPLETALLEPQNIPWRSRKLSKLFAQKIYLTRELPEDQVHSLENVMDPEELADRVAATLKADSYTKQELLETVNLEQRLDRLTELLEIELTKTG